MSNESRFPSDVKILECFQKRKIKENFSLLFYIIITFTLLLRSDQM